MDTNVGVEIVPDNALNAGSHNQDCARKDDQMCILENKTNFGVEMPESRLNDVAVPSEQGAVFGTLCGVIVWIRIEISLIEAEASL
ncbi:hypothetical protein A2U01_0003333 [Trifolium medium]|uniref:Uncharacterized protein n=1 Tax=Trifolium medium TaxID=97028 RepID=A0A392M5B3_9FABA|nr:hypothetical protein [Trifolium medium]